MQGASDDEEAKPNSTDKGAPQTEPHEESPDQVQYQDIDVPADDMFPDLEETKDKVEQIGKQGRVNVEEEVRDDKEASELTFAELLKKPPVKSARKNKDEYIQVEGMIVRIHRNKRRALFTHTKGYDLPCRPL